MNDEQYMQQAILCGEKARLIAPPNPWVGCILVKNDQIIGMGHTQPPGQNHAEVEALSSCIYTPEGCTAYVTLEPCAHTGKTPPCVDALIKAKVARVVIGLEDPDLRVSGKGIKKLKDSGIQVSIGVCAPAIKESFASYLHHRKTGFAYCLIKAAISIDGKIAALDGSSKWISSLEARRDAQILRAESQAILIGSGTALQDNPNLTVRDKALFLTKQPLRVIVDARRRIEPGLNILCTENAPTLIVTGPHCQDEQRKKWESCGAEVAVLPHAEGNQSIDLESLLKLLGQRGILQVLVEGGSVLHGSLLKKALCNRLVIYIGACLLGETGLSTFKGFTVNSINAAPQFELHEIKKLGSSVRLDYFPKA